MEENTNLVESLLERAAEYGKTSYELVKLNVVDKSSDAISSFMPQTVVVAIIGSFMLFLSLGIAFWLSEVLGKFYYGFLLVAGFYALIAIVSHFFMRKWLKRIFYDYLIRQMLK